jgi:hypothetical protein
MLNMLPTNRDTKQEVFEGADAEKFTHYRLSELVSVLRRFGALLFCRRGQLLDLLAPLHVVPLGVDAAVLLTPLLTPLGAQHPEKAGNRQHESRLR